MSADPHSSPQSSSQSSSARLLVITAALAIGAGLIIAALLLVASGRGGDAPKGPFPLGSAAGLRDEVKQSPVYIADPTGGDGLWLALRGKKIVALSAVPPGNSGSCTARWRDSVDAFQDCHGKRYHADELGEYPLELRNGSLYVDTRRVAQPG